jgi:flagellar biosynthesis chaperone FliJ
MDTLYGQKKLDNIDEQISLMKQENELLEEKANLAKDYMKEDITTLNETTSTALKKLGYTGFTFTIDDNGEISNYTEKMDSLYATYEKMVENWNKTYEGKVESDAATTAKDKIDALKKAIDDINDAVSEYDDDRTEYLDDLDQIQDNTSSIQSFNYSKITEKLEVKL